MSISTIGNYTPVQTQPTQYFGTSSLSATASTTTATATSAGAAPDGSSFINAIASALSDSGVTSPATTSADTTSSDTSTDPAKALGDFLHTLMQSLHSQDGGQQQGTDGAPPAHAHGGGGKGSHIKSDLQSLISSLGTSSTGDSTSTTSADGTTSTDSTTGADSTTSGLTASFKNLLGALGVDSADASSKLGQFLQTLSAKLDSSGPSGNLINTTA